MRIQKNIAIAIAVAGWSFTTATPVFAQYSEQVPFNLQAEVILQDAKEIDPQIFFYDLETGASVDVDLIDDERQGVTFRENMVLPGSLFAPELIDSELTVQYEITNNMAGFDIVGFGITNPSFYTRPFTPVGIECDTVPMGPCWASEGIGAKTILSDSMLNALPGPIEALFTALFEEEQFLHSYSFNAGEELMYAQLDDPMGTAVSPMYMMAQATPIFAGTTQSNFYFSHGLPHSNILGVAVDGDGNEVLFSNIQVAPVPLPAGALLLGAGLIGLGAMRRRA